VDKLVITVTVDSSIPYLGNPMCPPPTEVERWRTVRAVNQRGRQHCARAGTNWRTNTAGRAPLSRIDLTAGGGCGADPEPDGRDHPVRDCECADRRK
jgi:hypothetical protein